MPEDTGGEGQVKSIWNIAKDYQQVLLRLHLMAQDFKSKKKWGKLEGTNLYRYQDALRSMIAMLAMRIPPEEVKALYDAFKEAKDDVEKLEEFELFHLTPVIQKREMMGKDFIEGQGREVDITSRYLGPGKKKEALLKKITIPQWFYEVE